jgi:hypothetical protein
VANSKPLSDLVRIRHHFVRSVSLERDFTAKEMDSGYIPAGRALELVGRVVRGLGTDSAARALSITGPYGSGKSSFALFLDSLLGPTKDRVRQQAHRALQEADPALAEQLGSCKERLGAGRGGFIRAIATAEREPVSLTVLRALRVGSQRYWTQAAVPEPIARSLRTLETKVLAGGHPTGKDLLGVAEEMSRHAPVLLVLDEFGKSLEYWADSSGRGDLFLLQQLAERAADPKRAPLVLLTLQHLAFEEYTTAASEAARKELVKVQGRFEDVPFVDNPAVAARMIAQCLGASDRDTQALATLKRYGLDAHRAAERVGIAGVLDATPDLLAGCYPLHPMTLVLLPQLASGYAQSNRTLFSFVASREPGTLRRYIEEESFDGRRLPILTPDRLYDYFMDSMSTVVASSAGASRWMELERRVREASGLPAFELRCLKVIALLNLVGSGGVLRASRRLISFALQTEIGAKESGGQLDSCLTDLERRGFIVHRTVSDEFRIWQGSDFDIQAAARQARKGLAVEAPSRLVKRLAALAPIVAARHSQEVGMLRHFQRLVADAEDVSSPIELDADGCVVYLLDESDEVIRERLKEWGRPVVVVSTPDRERVLESAREAAALDAVLSMPELSTDWVARREVQERAAIAAAAFRDVMTEAFDAKREDVEWTLLNPRRRVRPTHGLSRALSDVCDQVYSDSPELHNEMIARTELTSQGAKARRELIEAMITRPSEPRLGLEGYGPERAIYEGLLAHTGLHRGRVGGSIGFGPPSKSSSFTGLWKAINETLDLAQDQAVTAAEVGQILSEPPFGLKAGAYPVVLAAVLLWRAEDVAVYQDGTYAPALTADLMERLVKTPERFGFRCFVVRGARHQLVEALASTPGLSTPRYKQRNATILSVTVPLLDVARSLAPYAQRTSTVSSAAAAVRGELLSAREPDHLLFVALPAALGLELTDRSLPKSAVDSYVASLSDAVDELSGAYAHLLSRIRDALRYHLRVPEGMEIRGDLSARASRLAGQILDQRLRSFLTMAADGTLDDEDWVEALAMNLAQKPPTQWTDEDEALFASTLKEIGGTFGRVEALHFEHRDATAEGFEAKRIAITAPDGIEVSRVVWINEGGSRQLGALVTQAIADAEARVGRGGGEALLALLAEHLYKDQEGDQLKESNLDAQKRVARK